MVSPRAARSSWVVLAFDDSALARHDGFAGSVVTPPGGDREIVARHVVATPGPQLQGLEHVELSHEHRGALDLPDRHLHDADPRLLLDQVEPLRLGLHRLHFQGRRHEGDVELQVAVEAGGVAAVADVETTTRRGPAGRVRLKGIRPGFGRVG